MLNKKNIAIIFKAIILASLLTIYFTVSMTLSGVAEQPANTPSALSTTISDSTRTLEQNKAQQSEEAGKILLILFFFFLMLSITWTIIILRSDWYGWKLAAAVFWAHYGIGTILPQIESIVYLPKQLPQGMVPKLFVAGFIVSLLFAPTATIILGRMKSAITNAVPPLKKSWSVSKWIWTSASVIVIYWFLYFTFGYYLAWKNPVLRDYYGGTDPGNFLAQMAGIWASTPWMFLLQAGRALMWVLFALPVIWMLRGKSWQVALSIACLFAVWSLLLLLPNPFMPREVAMTHLLETITSNFIFGWIVGWLFYSRDSGKIPAPI